MAKINDILKGRSPLRSNGYDPNKQVVKTDPVSGKTYIVDPNVSENITPPVPGTQAAGDLLPTDNLSNYQSTLVDLGPDFKPTKEQTAAANAKVAELKALDEKNKQENDQRGMAAHGIVGKKETTVTGELDTETTPGEKGMYNPTAKDAFNAKIADKQFNKLEKRKNRRNRKNIRRYEEGSRGFLGIGKGKGKGDMTGDVAGAYESVYGDKIQDYSDKKGLNLTIGPGGKVIGDSDQGLSTQNLSRKNRVQFDASQIRSGGTTSDTPGTSKIKNEEFKGDVNSVIDVTGGGKTFTETIPVPDNTAQNEVSSNVNAFGGRESIADKFKKTTDKMISDAGVGRSLLNKRTIAYKTKFGRGAGYKKK